MIGQLFVGKLGVGRRCRVDDQALHIRHIGQQREDLQMIDKRPGLLLSALDLKGEDRSAAMGEILLIQGVIRVIGQGGAGFLSLRPNIICLCSVARDTSYQKFDACIIGNAPCSGHTECDSIIMDSGKILAVPSLEANNVDAQLVHEAAIGKIAGEQLVKLMTLGLTEAEAEEQIINGFLK